MREAHITVVEQNGVSRTRPLVAPGLIIGRESDCDLVINYAKASRHHARILVDGSKYYVIDLGSGNGTYLADTKLSRDRPYEWLPGVPLRICDTLFYLESGELEPQEVGADGETGHRRRTRTTQLFDEPYQSDQESSGRGSYLVLIGLLVGLGLVCLLGGLGIGLYYFY